MEISRPFVTATGRNWVETGTGHRKERRGPDWDFLAPDWGRSGPVQREITVTYQDRNSTVCIVAGVRFCYCFVTVLLLYSTVLYGTVLWCTVVGLSCLLAQYWSCSVCVTPLVQFPLFSAVLFVLVDFVFLLNRFTRP